MNLVSTKEDALKPKTNTFRRGSVVHAHTSRAAGHAKFHIILDYELPADDGQVIYGVTTSASPESVALRAKMDPSKMICLAKGEYPFCTAEQSVVDVFDPRLRPVAELEADEVFRIVCEMSAVHMRLIDALVRSATTITPRAKKRILGL